MKQFKFASFAALSLTTTQAIKISKEFEQAEAKLMELQKEGRPPIDDVMQSVESLENAVKFHKKEESLLNEIGQDIKAFWREADQSKKYVSMDESAEDKSTEKTQEKAKAAAAPQVPQSQAQVQMKNKE